SACIPSFDEEPLITFCHINCKKVEDSRILNFVLTQIEELKEWIKSSYNFKNLSSKSGLVHLRTWDRSTEIYFENFLTNKAHEPDKANN
uniref:Reverse transcriptase n=1 Tax=Romanomermis culicivorax TaxID=13658 RepID=A0A915L8N5_ROMCU